MVYSSLKHTSLLLRRQKGDSWFVRTLLFCERVGLIALSVEQQAANAKYSTRHEGATAGKNRNHVCSMGQWVVLKRECGLTEHVFIDMLGILGNVD
ncbi:hypothetical protein SRHO_G00039740 [Serrasalmus rhombeus]